MRIVRSISPGLALAVGMATLALVADRIADVLSPLVVAVCLGVAIANSVGVPSALEAGLAFSAKRLLRLGVLLLGAQLSLSQLADVGLLGLVVVVSIVTIIFVGTRWLGARLGVSPGLSLVLATGNSICGASAIAAVQGVADADEDEVAYAVALVTMCGTLSIFVLPVVGGLLDLPAGQFGTWIGAGVHDVGQVVATASTHGPTSLQAAIVVKLARVVLLAPLVAGLAISSRRTRRMAAGHAKKAPLVPLFVVGFFGMAAARSFSVLGGSAVVLLSDVQTFVLSIALFAMGCHVRIARLRIVGWRPLVLGATTWLLTAGLALAGSVVIWNA